MQGYRNPCRHWKLSAGYPKLTFFREAIILPPLYLAAAFAASLVGNCAAATHQPNAVATESPPLPSVQKNRVPLLITWIRVPNETEKGKDRVKELEMEQSREELEEAGGGDSFCFICSSSQKCTGEWAECSWSASAGSRNLSKEKPMV